MIISLFIILLLIAVLLFIKGADDDAIAFYGISLVLFLMLSGLAFNITTPMMDPTGTIIEHKYIEFGLVAICPVFVFIDILMMILHFMHGRKMKSGAVPYVPPGNR